jgi:ATP-dependent DNA helicase 2 subunit 2
VSLPCLAFFIPDDVNRITMTTMRKSRTRLVPSNTDKGDAISAIVLAVQMIVTVCKKLKYLRKIVLVTNGTGAMDPDDVAAIADKLKEDDIQLIILGADFDDPDYGFQEDTKDPTKAENEKTLKDLADQSGGVFGTLAQAVEELGIPRIKAVNPVASYKGTLTLGDPTVYESAMAIDVERFPITMIARPPAASNFVVRSDMGPSQTAAGPSTAPQFDPPAQDDGLSAIHNARTYQVKDEEAPGGKKDIAREDLAKGFEYGRTAVHIAQSDENVTKLETKAMLSIVGFIPAANVGHAEVF